MFTLASIYVKISADLLTKIDIYPNLDWLDLSPPVFRAFLFDYYAFCMSSHGILNNSSIYKVLETIHRI